jgi:hypothetical protein
MIEGTTSFTGPQVRLQICSIESAKQTSVAHHHLSACQGPLAPTRVVSQYKPLRAGTDIAVTKYIDLHRATSENKYLYQGAFATGVRRVKVAHSSKQPVFEPLLATATAALRAAEPLSLTAAAVGAGLVPRGAGAVCNDRPIAAHGWLHHAGFLARIRGNAAFFFQEGYNGIANSYQRRRPSALMRSFLPLSRNASCCKICRLLKDMPAAVRYPRA